MVWECCRRSVGGVGCSLRLVLFSFLFPTLPLTFASPHSLCVVLFVVLSFLLCWSDAHVCWCCECPSILLSFPVRPFLFPFVLLVELPLGVLLLLEVWLVGVAPLLAILLLGWTHHLFLDINGCFSLFGEIPTEYGHSTRSDK